MLTSGTNGGASPGFAFKLGTYHNQVSTDFICLECKEDRNTHLVGFKVAQSPFA